MKDIKYIDESGEIITEDLPFDLELHVGEKGKFGKSTFVIEKIDERKEVIGVLLKKVKTTAKKGK